MSPAARATSRLLKEAKDANELKGVGTADGAYTHTQSQNAPKSVDCSCEPYTKTCPKNWSGKSCITFSGTPRGGFDRPQLGVTGRVTVQVKGCAPIAPVVCSPTDPYVNFGALADAGPCTCTANATGYSIVCTNTVPCGVATNTCTASHTITITGDTLEGTYKDTGTTGNPGTCDKHWTWSESVSYAAKLYSSDPANKNCPAP